MAMGSSASKRRPTHTQVAAPIVQPEAVDDYFVQIACDSERRRNEVERLRTEFKRNIQTFLLNQVLFSVMFFNNYEQELESLTPNENISVKELSMTEDLFLTCLQPDEVFSLVNNHVYFCPRHGRNKGKASPLVTNRIFVIHENIQVVDDEVNHYANIDKPSLTAQVLQKHRKGYVRLRYIEDMRFKSSVSSNSSSSATPIDDVSSADGLSDIYRRISDARCIKPIRLDVTKPSTPLYPITQVKKRNYDAESDDDLFIYEHYVDSKLMKEKFQQNWARIAELLELDDEDVSRAGFNCDSIFCHSKSTNTMWEIIPAVQLPKDAYQYFLEAKSSAAVLRAKNKGRRFPTREMLNNIVQMDCLAMPRGFMSKYKNEENPEYHLEWELAHPKVEKYLQASFTHTHMRMLLMLVLLHKNYVEPETNTQGITLRHLVIHLFWELQKDVVIDETRLGNRLIDILKTLCHCLGIGILRDYFVEERNHFENIPSPNLRRAQEIFSGAKDSPLLHMMQALRNLHYVHNDYPELNVKELYRILTTSSTDLLQIVRVPRIVSSVGGKIPWEQRRRTIIMRERQKQERQTQENLTLAAKPRASVDSIDRTHNMNKINENQDEWLMKARPLLLFFLDHYLKMAACCAKLSNDRQSASYLHQAELLVYLFHNSCQTDAIDYQRRIAELRRTLRDGSHEVVEYRRRSTTSGPELPDRSSGAERRASNSHMRMMQTQSPTRPTRPHHFRKRNESENSNTSNKSGGSDQGVIHHPSGSNAATRVQRTKSVNFASHVQIGKNPKSLGQSFNNVDNLRPGIKRHERLTDKSKSVSFDTEDKKNDTYDSDELEGLDEIVSDDDKDDDHHRIKLHHVDEESFS